MTRPLAQAGDVPEDWTWSVAVLMAIYHRSDAEIFDMDEDRMDAILSTVKSMLEMMYSPRL